MIQKPKEGNKVSVKEMYGLPVISLVAHTGPIIRHCG
jgi:hypothetical protein